MSRFQLAKNSFSNLADDDEDLNDYVEPQTNSASSAAKSDFQPGAKRQPMTYSQIFEKALNGRDKLSLNELANVLDESLRIHQDERLLYCDKYDKYDKFDPEQYEELIDKRTNCFTTRNQDQDFVNLVISTFPKEITLNEIKSLIDSAVDKLSKKKPTGHGSLFLIDLLFQRRPEIFNQASEEKNNLFHVKHEDVVRAGPPTLWLISRALSSPSEVKFTTNELVSLFLNELLNTSEVSVSGPYSVWASHLINRNYKKTKDNSLSAHIYTEMIPLFLRLKGSNINNRDQHIRSVLNQFFINCHIIDPINYAREIMLHYPKFEDTPKEVKVSFMEQVQKSPAFIKGWVNCHDDPSLHSTSNDYLQTVSQAIPSVLNSFPENVIATCNNEIAELKLKDKGLFQTSIRFTIAIVVVSVGFFLKKYEIL